MFFFQYRAMFINHFSMVFQIPCRRTIWYQMAVVEKFYYVVNNIYKKDDANANENGS